MIVLVTGGIGCGKSVVSDILRKLGYNVIDCDREAKRIMDSSESIKREIAKRISSDAVINGQIKRELLADIVFNDREKLKLLNSIVHSHVRKHVAELDSDPNRILFVETAIPYSSGLNKLADRIWEVKADTETRIQRIVKRNGFAREEVIKRMDSQCAEYATARFHSVFPIFNNDEDAVLPQILDRLSLLNKKGSESD